MRIRSGFFLALLLGCSHALSAAVLYNLTDLGALGGLSSHAYGVNNLGQAVGESDTRTGASSAFLYSNGQMADLGTLGGESSRANGINDAGQVTGSFTMSDGGSHAFLYSNGQV